MLLRSPPWVFLVGKILPFHYLHFIHLLITLPPFFPLHGLLIQVLPIMTVIKHNLTNSKPYIENDHITTANGHHLSIYGIGSTRTRLGPSQSGSSSYFPHLSFPFPSSSLAGRLDLLIKRKGKKSQTKREKNNHTCPTQPSPM